MRDLSPPHSPLHTRVLSPTSGASDPTLINPLHTTVSGFQSRPRGCNLGPDGSQGQLCVCVCVCDERERECVCALVQFAVTLMTMTPVEINLANF